MIKLKNICKTYNDQVEACKDVTLDINDKDIYGIIGYSGAGKSTLVRCINFLEIPTSGTIEFDDLIVNAKSGKLYISKDGKEQLLKDKELRNIRKKIGMIFQHFNLLDRSNVYDNVAYSLKYSGLSRKEIDEKVKRLLELVGLSDKINSFPSELSGGQKQRVAIARALANDPKILLSDEATSALDPEVTNQILDLLKELNKKLGLTIIIITHEMNVVKTICNKVAVMENGNVVEVGDVYDVFAEPKSDVTKKFVNSTSALGKIDKLIEHHSELIKHDDKSKLVKLTFGKDSVGDSVISSMSRDYGVNINIVLANVETLGDSSLGGLIAVFSGERVNDALAYLCECNVKVELLEEGKDE